MAGEIGEVNVSVFGKTFNSRTTQNFTLTAKDLVEIFYVLVSAQPQADADFVPPGAALSLTGMPPAEGEILAGKTPVQQDSPKAGFGILNLQNLFNHSHTEFTYPPPSAFLNLCSWWFVKPRIIHGGVPFRIHQGDLDIVVPGEMPTTRRGEERLHLRMEGIDTKARQLHLLMSEPLGMREPIPFTIRYTDGTQSIVWACVNDSHLGLTTTSFVPAKDAPDTVLCYHDTLEIPHPERTIQAIEGQGRFILIAATLEF